MTAEAGHNYTFGSPSKGWPSFGPDGKIVREAEREPGTNPMLPDCDASCAVSIGVGDHWCRP